jgi:hypothetical protein
MNRLIAAITGLHVLVHGIFGCCDHGLAASRAAVPCHCDHAHHGDLTESAGEHDLADHDLADHKSPVQGSHECVHAACHWLADNASPHVGELYISGVASLATQLPASMALTVAAEFLPADILGPISAPPLRLHLALGVLQI